MFVLSLVLFVGIFSTTAHAEEITNFNTDANIRLFNGSNVYYNGSFDVLDDKDLTCYLTSVPMDYATQFEYKVTIENGSIIAKKDQHINFTISNMIYYVTINGSTYNWSKSDTTNKTVMLVHTDGTYTYVYDNIVWNYSSGNVSHNVSVDVTPEKDVRKIIYLETTTQYSQTGKHGVFNLTCGFGYAPTVQLDVETKSEGLLSNIKNAIVDKFFILFDWLADIYNTMVDFFSDINTWLRNIQNGITEVPEKIGDRIMFVLKEFFIPDEYELKYYFDDFKLMLEEHFGLLVQIFEILSSCFDSIKTADLTDSIEIPATTINFGDTPFTFGGYTVKIVPDGFSVMVAAVKSLTGILCTIAFVNGMRRRYDEVMGVKS